MYRCQVCDNVSEPGELLKVFRVMRTVPNRAAHVHHGEPLPQRQEIAKEIKVCACCHVQLEAGVPLTLLLFRAKGLTDEGTKQGPKLVRSWPTLPFEKKRVVNT